MSKPKSYRKKPVEVKAVQWHQNGDHPGDNLGEMLTDPLGGPDYRRLEGAVVRFYRRPDVRGGDRHCDLYLTKRPDCSYLMRDHGWIDTLEGGHTVCPGDWIITGVQGERYPCRPDIFDATYEEA